MNANFYMRRCFDLARLGAGAVSPNPLVGAVLVHEGRIIGEGWHQKYGEAHAEVNCVRSVRPADRALIPESTLYCSLEPCFHYGKTPPCVDLILRENIRRVVVANVDPNPKVAGQSLLKLQAAGVETASGVLETEGLWLNRAFFTWITRNRPYVILKWAQSADGFLGWHGQRTAISGPTVRRLVHRWRSESDAILVGSETALIDNPRLDARHYFGKNPLRVAFDRQGRLPAGSHLLDDTVDTWIFGPAHPGEYTRTIFIPAADRVSVPDLLERLHEARRAILLVEGGAEVLSQFLESGLWDEIRVIENPQWLGSGLAAPGVPEATVPAEEYRVGEDWVRVLVPFRQNN